MRKADFVACSLSPDIVSKTLRVDVQHFGSILRGERAVDLLVAVTAPLTNTHTLHSVDAKEPNRGDITYQIYMNVHRFQGAYDSVDPTKAVGTT